MDFVVAIDSNSLVERNGLSSCAGFGVDSGESFYKDRRCNGHSETASRTDRRDSLSFTRHIHAFDQQHDAGDGIGKGCIRKLDDRTAGRMALTFSLNRNYHVIRIGESDSGGFCSYRSNCLRKSWNGNSDGAGTTTTATATTTTAAFNRISR